MKISLSAFVIEKEVPLREREIESVLSLGNGYIGTRNSLEENYPSCDPGMFIAGFYVQGPEDEFNFLVRAPDWTRIKIYVEDELLNLNTQKALCHSRYIDYETGATVREWHNQDEQGRVTLIKIVKFISLAQKNRCGKLLSIVPENYSGKIRVETGIDCNIADFDHLLNMNSDIEGAASARMREKHSDREFLIVQRSEFDLPEYRYSTQNLYSGSFENFEWRAEIGKTYVIKSLCTLDNMSVGSFDNSFGKHRDKWIQRWEESGISITGNDYDRKLVDFAVYHLITAGEFSGNTHSIPARNLSGESYKGHVFWDTEMYLVPFFTLTKPEIARELLLYRYNTLDGARQNARNEGKQGASYAWESTDSGLEMTPELVVIPNGEVVQILSGRYENHISPDIAYAVGKYYEATHDKDFMEKYGNEIILETAKFCESLLEKGNDGLYHINTVIGPDEYHEMVNDNAYTNYLAKNNFDLAFKIDQDPKWKEYSKNMYSGLNPKTGLFEQFKEFYELEYVDLDDFEPRSVPMDIILGRETTPKTQVIKQADVLMFMFMFGERFSKEDLAVNYDFYEKRCGHGSSLSPSIHSIIAARAGKTPDAYKYFLQNAKIDIGDAFGNAAGGIHIASLGGVWMSVVMGFAGLYSTEKGIIMDPHLPDEWESIGFSIKWRGQTLNIAIDRHKTELLLEGNSNIGVSVGFNNWKELTPGKTEAITYAGQDITTS